MTVVSRYTENGGDGGLMFDCPGCHQTHAVGIGSGPGPRWGFNGDTNKPTLTPSLLVRSGHYAHGGQVGNCWCDYEARLGKKPGFSCYVCHSFVVDGRIQFLGDCTHALAGQTVDLPECEE
jgi:hypothetical protein